MNKTLIIRFSSLGDVILTLPTVQAASAASEVHVLTKKAFEPIYKMHGVAVKIHTIPDHASLGELKAVCGELAKERWDEILDLHNNIRSRIACGILKSSAARVSRVKKPRVREGLLFILKQKIFAAIFGIDALSRRNAALSLAGGDEKIKTQMKNVGAAPGEFNLPKAFVAVSPESLWRQKEWAAANYTELTRRFLNAGHAVVFVGKEMLPPAPPGVLDLRGSTSIEQAASVLKSARVLVCNDSGLMHLAEAVGTPVVACFGPTSRALGFAPTLSGSKMSEAGLWCRPCSKTGKWCFRITDRRKCLRLISVDAVERDLLSVLRENPGR